MECKALTKLTDSTIEDHLKEEVDLSIRAKLEGKKSKSEIVSLTQKYHNGIQTGVDEVNNVRITISFYMGWQKKGVGHTYDSNPWHVYFIGV